VPAGCRFTLALVCDKTEDEIAGVIKPLMRVIPYGQIIREAEPQNKRSQAGAWERVKTGAWERVKLVVDTLLSVAPLPISHKWTYCST
jgi:hypothetical protein